MQKLAAKLVSVMKEVAYVEKKGNNEYHQYSYATSADVLLKINAALTKYNICSITLPEMVSIVDVVTAKGNTEHLATVKMDIMLVDAESGETVTITGLGSGQDSGDKAVMKAQTAAIKYAYLLAMAISTGDDPEADSKTDEGISSQETNTHCANGKFLCHDCGCKITSGIRNVSVNKFGKPLCMKCQKKMQDAA